MGHTMILHVSNKKNFIWFVLVCSISMSENSVLGWTNCWAMWALVRGVHMFRVYVIVNFLLRVVDERAAWLGTTVFSFFQIVKHF